MSVNMFQILYATNVCHFDGNIAGVLAGYRKVHLVVGLVRTLLLLGDHSPVLGQPDLLQKKKNKKLGNIKIAVVFGLPCIQRP